MSHRTHSYVMLGLLAGGAALFFTGVVNAGVLFLLWPLLCMGMMFGMMWFMGGMSAPPAKHTHADGTTHAHHDVSTDSRT